MHHRQLLPPHKNLDSFKKKIKNRNENFEEVEEGKEEEEEEVEVDKLTSFIVLAAKGQGSH